MADEEKTNLRLEIAHVLFMDIVGYSKLLVDEQREALHELNDLVLNTEAAREAEAAGQLVRLPTGDGMALVFTSSMEAPVECALQISQGLRAQPSLPLRMGIHSGSVQHVRDVNGRENIAGAGINIAQRVMDCGDAGHILVSKRVADDLAGSRRWAPYLHELGECEVKHGVVVSLVNLYADVVGNPAPPGKFGDAKGARRKPVRADGTRMSAGRRLLIGVAVVVAVAAVAWAAWRRSGAGGRAGSAVVKPAAATAGPAVDAPEKSIAVLPFDNFSEDKDSAFFAEGVQDEILTDLAKVADLKVISRSSVMQYRKADSRNLREVGKALGVTHVVEGSVQRAGDKIRVTAQLIDARTDAHQWAEHYDRDLADVFAIQSEIAQAIAGHLQAAISPQEHAAMMEVPTRDEQAYQLYLRANALWEDVQDHDFGTSRTVQPEVIGLLKQATARDPDFVRAFVLMAEVQCYAYFNQGKTTENADAARRNAETVARLRPGSTDANVVMGEYDYYVRLNYPRAQEEFAAVVRQSPNDGRAVFLLGSVERRQGHWDDSLDHMRRAMELDPERNVYFSTFLEVLDALRRYPEEEAALDRRLAAHPKQLEWHLEKAWLSLSRKADTRAARAELALLPPDFDPGGGVTSAKVTCDEMDRNFAAAARTLAACPLAEIDGVPRSVIEGDVAYRRGDARAAAAAYAAARPSLAEVVRTQPENFYALLDLAEVDAGLGDKAAALDEGRRAVAMIVAGDVREGVRVTTRWATVLNRAGEREEAIRTLQTVCGKPYGPTYGWLHGDPEWDPLRGDARFKAMVASLAPR